MPDQTQGTTRAPGGLVLVVDADPMFGILVEACIDFEGASVISASSVAEASPLVRDGLTGLVIEPDLPDGDGHELLALVARHCPGIPVVVCADPAMVGELSPADWPGARVQRVDKADLARMVQLLQLADEPDHLPTDRLLHISALDLGDVAGPEPVVDHRLDDDLAGDVSSW